MLRTKEIQVSHDRVEAIHGVNISVEEGQIVTIIGPNGAGKSTLLSALIGFLPYQGEIWFRGKLLSRTQTVEQSIGTGIGLVPETRELFSEMTVRDNLILGGFSRYLRRDFDAAESLESVFHLFPRLRERQQQLVLTLSGGERQMLALGRALVGRPALLMLDEPSLGLAPLVCRSIFETIKALRDQGVSILLVEQNARAALKIADYAYVLEGGMVSMHGTAAQMAQSSKVIESYLGLNSNRKHEA